MKTIPFACVLAISLGLMTADGADEKKAETKTGQETKKENKSVTTNEVAVIKTTAGEGKW
jgi:hypothetical protein